MREFKTHQTTDASKAILRAQSLSVIDQANAGSILDGEVEVSLGTVRIFLAPEQRQKLTEMEKF